MRRFALLRLLPALLSALLSALLLAGAARADVKIPGFELVHTAPLETSLSNDDLRDPVTVWSELFDGAVSEIAIGQFYVAAKDGAPFDRVLERLTLAGQRGVKIRFLMDKKGVGLSDAALMTRLRAIPNLELRILDYGKLTGNGIIHAKYVVADRNKAYIGSQNFDWRAFSQIHETGLLITDAAIVAQTRAIFEHDWKAQASIAAGNSVAPLNTQVVKADLKARAFLVASPNAFNPNGVGDSESALPALLAEAKNEVRVQLLDYAPLSYGPGGTRPYYGMIDTALRTAATRGVKILLMVSNWNTEKPAIAHLKSLALLPNVQIRIVTLPQASSGFIPFARVIHSKTMVIDGKIAWVGTSNWGGGYFDHSRNLELVLRDETMAQRVAALHEQAWSSTYAASIDVMKDYPKPAKGSPE